MVTISAQETNYTSRILLHPIVNRQDSRIVHRTIRGIYLASEERVRNDYENGTWHVVCPILSFHSRTCKSTISLPRPSVAHVEHRSDKIQDGALQESGTSAPKPSFGIARNPPRLDIRARGNLALGRCGGIGGHHLSRYPGTEVVYFEGKGPQKSRGAPLSKCALTRPTGLSPQLHSHLFPRKSSSIGD